MSQEYSKWKITGSRMEVTLPYSNQPNIYIPIHLKSIDADKWLEVKALIDTGASQTFVSPKVIEALGCNAVGTSHISHAGNGNGSDAMRYESVIGFPNMKAMRWRITELEMTEDMLLGLDVLACFKFCVENIDRKSFRVILEI